MFQFLTHVELSRSMAAILEMPQYVAYQKNVIYTFIKLSAKSHSFNILRTMDGLSCPTRDVELFLVLIYMVINSMTDDNVTLMGRMSLGGTHIGKWYGDVSWS